MKPEWKGTTAVAIDSPVTHFYAAKWHWGARILRNFDLLTRARARTVHNTVFLGCADFFFFQSRILQYFSPRAAVLDPKFRADHESGLRIDQRSAADDENWILTFAVEC